MTPEDFPAFFRAVHGQDPFPWQAALARRVAGTGWPALLDLPTGSGKTAVIDIAVFTLALEIDRPAAERRAPLRLFFAIDRRIVVDDVARRADHLRDRLDAALTDDAADAVATTVARRLAGGTGKPLHTATLRGGTLHHDADWARSPAQPLVCVTTVDQLGSRLLFRGYGVSEGMRPVHAGLTGNDALIVLDEAHLSRPFEQTLATVRRLRGNAGTPFHVVRMSATPGGPADAFTLGAEDRTHPVLSRRLSASKPARLVVAPARGAGLEEELAAQALRLLGETPPCAGGGPAVGVVVNRVGTARAVFERLRAARPEVDAALLTGRVRPLDRDRLLAELLPRIRAGRAEDAPAGGPLLLVATQCIEAGADLDLDALVTEAASLDALRQRFGRLDRLGRRGLAPAAVVAPKDAFAKNATDPLYGTALREGWAWLMANATVTGKGRAAVGQVDFGVEALAALMERTPPGDAAALAARAPVLSPAVLDLLARTAPAPHPDPDIAPFLHGLGRDAADVFVVWRADLPALDDHDPKSPDADILELDIARRLTALPPSALEAMALPRHVAVAWLTGTRADAPDAEGATAEPLPAEAAPRWFVRWRGADECRIENRPFTLRPGDTIVLPAGRGGCDRYGWAPDSGEPVTDLAEEAARARGRRLHRFHPNLPTTPPWEEAAALIALHITADRVDAAGLIGALSLDGDWTVIPYAEGGVLLVERRRKPDDVAPDGDGLLHTTPVLLAPHLDRVAEVAGRLARAAGLPEDLVADITLAARLHDIGKAEPRFQAMLRGGDAVAAATRPPLAKSLLPDRDRARWHAAREAAGLPEGARHEAWSVALLRDHPRLRDAADPELLLWLVGTHHGQGRPWFPAVPDRASGRLSVTLGGDRFEGPVAHELERLDGGWPELMERLLRRYGAWGLAHLETVLRLADQRASADEMREAAP
ncbi:type I-U CRISPR-associated helicase/endonuclease Cas3 [Azospirillum sp. RWY-5-1]|uniref:Type I-U CRISPR-associated helicase/endonuclease Cas3 n=1 Tax=Azospirillum oleiclasticum TaxID=2735135 RepID=A0ABX2TDB1_9PROT|nr:type I-U CRISPR-associated helicase/endonuclease Cas3 [Azospirillum oleiclasticum]NYZ20705.1 type I-U CRISPR-associated helicase/endonuclease Cas3 [Azospirillum oleiclasticum]